MNRSVSDSFAHRHRRGWPVLLGCALIPAFVMVVIGSSAVWAATPAGTASSDNTKSTAASPTSAESAADASAADPTCAATEAGERSLARLDAISAERLFRQAEKTCPSAVSAGNLALAIYSQAIGLADTHPDKPRRLKNALAHVNTALEREKLADLLILRAAISGTLAIVETNTTDAARLFLDSYRDGTEALTMHPDHPQGLIVLGSWHKAAEELGFAERMFIRFAAGPVPDSSLRLSKALLERAAGALRTPTAYFHLGATYEAMGQQNAAWQTWERCARAKPKTVDDLPVPGWCRNQLQSRND